MIGGRDIEVVSTEAVRDCCEEDAPFDEGAELICS